MSSPLCPDVDPAPGAQSTRERRRTEHLMFARQLLRCGQLHGDCLAQQRPVPRMCWVYRGRERATRCACMASPARTCMSP